MQDWEIVIGLEIHTQLKTKSKIFSGASTDFGAAPNTQACAIDLGFPGVLPAVNTRVYEKAVAFGLAIGATINLTSVFDRKNYFYPDSPKGYQITQLETQIVVGGSVDIILKDGSVKTIQVTRAHLEEDAGKSMHEDYHGKTGIDLNRAGTPLLEIVSEPDMRSAEEAVAYARYIHQLVTYLGVSDGDMSQGSLRCDANVSIRPMGTEAMGTRTETKNVNSFRFLERAINHEVERQIAVLKWSMVMNSDGSVGDYLNLPNSSSKGNGGRVVPLNKDLKLNLIKLLQEHSSYGDFDLQASAIIRTERSKGTSSQAIVNMFQRWYYRLGLIGCSSHSGRRTFITNAARKISTVGGSLRDVQMLAGHSSLAVTQRYIDGDSEARRKIVDLI